MKIHIIEETGITMTATIELQLCFVKHHFFVKGLFTTVHQILQQLSFSAFYFTYRKTMKIVIHKTSNASIKEIGKEVSTFKVINMEYWQNITLYQVLYLQFWRRPTLLWSADTYEPIHSGISIVELELINARWDNVKVVHN